MENHEKKARHNREKSCFPIINDVVQILSAEVD